MDKGWCGSCYLPDYAITIQKSIVDSTVDSTKEESDFDKSCHSERSEESDGAYEQAAVGPSEGFLLNRDPSLRSE